jgi:hypothetical protein
MTRFTGMTRLTGRRLLVTALTLLAFASLLPVLAQTDWRVVKTFQVGAQGGWDYVTVDPRTHRLYQRRRR